MFRFTSAVAAMLCVHTVSAQPRFQANSPLVLVPVAVTDKKGAPIDGLHVRDFLVSDGSQHAIYEYTADGQRVQMINVPPTQDRCRVPAA